MAAFGGLTCLWIERDGAVKVERLPLSTDLVNALERNIMLFYTHATRDATSILEKQNMATIQKEKHVLRNLSEIKDLGVEIREAILSNNLRKFGELLDAHWQCKKALSRDISNSQIDDWYALAKRNGAIGGKISGAGGGGFLMLYCEDDKQRLRQAMCGAGLRELHFRIEFEGSKVVFDVVSRDQRLAHIARLQTNHRDIDSISGTAREKSFVAGLR
jgi:D-glycero-alpha-D-manno-heptose-7-phosphate kinase